MTPARLVISTSVFLTLFYNTRFFKNIADIYPISPVNIVFSGSVAIILTCLMIVLITLISSKYTLKPILILVLPLSALASYFMNSYNVIIDENMIQNVIETNVSESMDLLSFKLLAYFLLLGIVPSVWIYKVKIEYGAFKTEILTRLKLIIISLAVRLEPI